MAAALLLVGAPRAARAHSLHVTAIVSGELIHGRVFYTEDAPAANAVVTLTLRGEGETVLRTRTDLKGRYRLPIPCRADLLVKAEADGLHRARTAVAIEVLPARLPDIDSYLRGFRGRGGVIAELPPPDEKEAAALPVGPPVPIANAPSVIRAPGGPGLSSTTALRDPTPMSREELETRKQELLRLERSVRLRDIGAGIGYIVGLLGVIAWWKSRARTVAPAPPVNDGFPESPA